MHWEDPEESGGEGGGRGDRDGEYRQNHGWFMSIYDKNDYNIKKEKNKIILEGVPWWSSTKILLSQCRGAWIQSLIKELAPTRCNKDQRSQMPQLRPDAAK